MGAGIRRWGVFNLVGLGGFVLQVGAIALLTRVLGWSALPATAVGVELAFLHNFLGHNRWTWSDYPLVNGRAWLNRWWRYQAAKTASLGASVLLTTAFAALPGVPVEAANALAVAVCAVPNFIIADRFVFSRTAVSTSTTRCRGRAS